MTGPFRPSYIANRATRYTILDVRLGLVDTERIRELSKALLGNCYRLEIAAGVSKNPTGLLHAMELSDKLSIPHNLVSAQLKAFVAVGVMEKVGVVTGQRFRYFRRIDHPYWRACEELLEDLTRQIDGAETALSFAAADRKLLTSRLSVPD